MAPHRSSQPWIPVLEHICHELDLVDHDEPPHLFVEIKVRFFQHLTVNRPFQIEIDRIAACRDVLSKCRLTNLPRSKQDNTCPAFQCFFN